MATLNDIETKIQSIISILKSRIVKTITGTLPLTFTTKAGNAVDWTIDGNAQGVGERTSNLFDKTATDTNNGYEANKLLKSDGAVAPNSNYAVSEYIPISSSQTYLLKWYGQSPPSSTAASIGFYDSSKTFISGVAYGTSAIVTTTAPANAVYARISTHANYLDNTMLVKGSTAPSTYVPYGYEIPISTQGKNLFDKTNLVTGSYYTAQGHTGNSDDWSRTVNAIPVQPSTEYTFEPNSTAGASAKHLYLDADKNFISAIASGGSTFTTPSNCYYMQFSLRTSSTNTMLVKGSTAPTEYISYFHNDYTFYIGDSPLTEGETVSNTSTGVDIELFEGENTVSTTLYNKPEMTIKYKYNGGN